jgi:hypothetical protein
MVFNKSRVMIITLLSIALFAPSIIKTGYGYWDKTNKDSSESISLGVWTYVPLLIGLDFTSDLSGFMDNELGLDPTSNYQYIYSQTDMPANSIVTINSIDLFGYNWDFWGKVKNPGYPTLGYPVLIDRSVDEFGEPVHDIAPSYSTTPLYPEYNYFTAYDANNLHTNNLYSLRLNYNTRMTTTTTVGQVTNVSFYAAVGLADSDDGAAIRDNQKVLVEVSSNGTQWTKISNNSSTPQVASEDEYFTFYSYDVSGVLLGQDLYVRIRYNGRTLNFNGVPSFGRLIIDELVITTN